METEKATPDNVDGFEIARMARLLGRVPVGLLRLGPPAGSRAQPGAAAPQRPDGQDHHPPRESDQVYGSPRILADLREAGEQVSAKTVAKLMRQAGIAGISPRGFVPVTTQAGPDPQPVDDLVGRRFDQGQLNRVWTSDITYLATGEGWLYLCAIRDGCSRRVVGWAIEDHLRTDLVEAALRQASRCAESCPRKSSSTPTAAPSTPRSRSPTPAPTCPCCARWAGPGCAGTTPPPSRSGPP